MKCTHLLIILFAIMIILATFAVCMTRGALKSIITGGGGESSSVFTTTILTNDMLF